LEKVRQHSGVAKQYTDYVAIKATKAWSR